MTSTAYSFLVQTNHKPSQMSETRNALTVSVLISISSPPRSSRYFTTSTLPPLHAECTHVRPYCKHTIIHATKKIHMYVQELTPTLVPWSLDLFSQSCSGCLRMASKGIHRSICKHTPRVRTYATPFFPNTCISLVQTTFWFGDGGI